MCKELAYRNNMILSEKGNAIKKYVLEPLPETSLDKIIVAVPEPGKDRREKTVDYQNLEIPFFGDKNSKNIETLITSKISNFLLCHMYEGKRKSGNYENRINAIGVDIDEGITLQEMLDLLNKIDIIYILYTTKSHQKEKNGIVCDRYRILIPFKFHIQISEDLFPIFYDNIMEVFGITTHDKATRSLSRLWFTNSDAEVYINKDGNLFDALSFLPETEKNEKLENSIKSLENVEEDKIGKRLFGMKKWLLANTSIGNRNDNLFKFGMFVRDLGLDFEEHIIEVNKLLDEELPEREIKRIIDSISRR
jgi:hypothetical protein